MLLEIESFSSTKGTVFLLEGEIVENENLGL